jgi:hypothetical protein
MEPTQPRTVVTSALAVRHSNHSARSHPHMNKTFCVLFDSRKAVISKAGHRHRGRCRFHRHSGILYLSPVPEHSGTGLGFLIRLSTSSVRHRHSGIPASGSVISPALPSCGKAGIKGCKRLYIHSMLKRLTPLSVEPCIEEVEASYTVLHSMLHLPPRIVRHRYLPSHPWQS